MRNYAAALRMNPLGLLLFALLVALPGCKEADVEPPPPGAAREVVAVDQSSAEAAARSALRLTRALRDSRAEGDKAAEAAILAQLQGLAARQVIFDRYERLRMAVGPQEEDLILTFVKGWPAILSAVLDDIDIEAPLAILGGAAGSAAMVLYSLPPHRTDLVLRIECTPSDNRWEVARLDFVPRPPLPSTQTAPAPK